MKISLLTLFPEMFASVFDLSIIKRAQEKKLLDIDVVDIRSYAADTYKTVDDHPYGGGVGMVMRVDVIDRALQSVKRTSNLEPRTSRIILLDPQGKPYFQQTARTLGKLDHLILICGHYEGVDERVRALVDEEISIGDYVLTGGEIPAMVIVDSVARLIPGVLSKKEATLQESFSARLLEYPQYTRPESYEGMKAPKILLSGNHAAIAKWRAMQSQKKTKKRRPDLLKT